MLEIIRREVDSGGGSGEEVSVSLSYALWTTDRLTPPIRVSKTEAPPKMGWYPKWISLGMKPKKNTQAENGKNGPNTMT
jgi:hypothetical protein